MLLSVAIDGFLLFRESGGLRPATISNYRFSLNQFLEWYGDKSLDKVKDDDINRFLLYLRRDYIPQRPGGSTRPYATQSVYNAYTALKAFSRWMHESLNMPELMNSKKVPRPRVVNEERHPFTEEEAKMLVNSIKPVRGRLATSGLYFITDLRDRAMLLTLLDTGVRASELIHLTIADVDLKSGRVAVTDGKGGWSRVVWIGAVTRSAVWRYVQERTTPDPAWPLFSAFHDSRPQNPQGLNKRLKLIGKRAGVANVYAHRFRYTFAIQFLRNGGDPFTLQQLLGHKSMTMVQRYLKLAAADINAAHRRASPIDGWFK